MAKAGFWLRGAKGKFAGAVMQGSGVGTIQRENVTPSNPQTENQVAQRAKFKLMSQIAAVLAPVIVIPKEDGVSPRNQFVKNNFGYVAYSGGQALVTYENLQLTNSTRGLPGITATRAENKINLSLSEPKAGINRVVYALYTKTEENHLDYLDSIVVNTAGDQNVYPAELPDRAGDIVVYAYGVIDSNAGVTNKYGNLQAETAKDFASLLVNKQMSSSDFIFTRTRGTTLFSGETEVTPPTPSTDTARLFLTAVGPGTVNGAGTFPIGETVTILAVPNTGATFDGWFTHGQNGENLVSNDAEYSFQISGLTELYAHFLSPSGSGVDD